MIFSNPSEYAIRALSELALLTQDGTAVPGRRPGYVMLDTLTNDTTLPREFLAKIFRQLVEAHILKSAKGPGGGFALARPAEKISLLHIVEAIDGESRLNRCVIGMSRCNDVTPCAQHELFKPVRERLRIYLTDTTLAETAAALKKKRGAKGSRRRS